jgi:hypothetical protein
MIEVGDKVVLLVAAVEIVSVIFEVIATDESNLPSRFAASSPNQMMLDPGWRVTSHTETPVGL